MAENRRVVTIKYNADVSDWQRNTRLVDKSLDDLNRSMDELEMSARGLRSSTGLAGSGLNDLRNGALALAGALSAHEIIEFGGRMNEWGTQMGVASSTLDVLAGSQENATAIMGALDAATGDTLNSLELLGIASSSLSLRLFDSNEQMIEMIGNATRLGAAVGSSPLEAVEALQGALRNNSFEVLDSISVNSGEARRRVAELTAAGYDMSEAYTIATQEGLAAGVIALGSASEAAFTPINQLTSRFEDLVLAASGDLAAGVHGAANAANAWLDRGDRIEEEQARQAELNRMADILLTPEAMSQSFGEDTLGVFTLLNTAAREYEILMGAAIQNTEELQQALVNIGQSADFTERFPEESSFFLNARFGVQQHVQQIDFLRSTTISAFNDIQARMEAMPSLPEIISRGGHNLLLAENQQNVDMMGGWAGQANQMFAPIMSGDMAATSAAAEQARAYADMFQTSLDEANLSFEAGLLSEAHLDRARDYASEMDRMAATVEQMAERYESMSLAQRLAGSQTGDMSRLGELGAMALGGADLSPEEMQAAQLALDLYTGQVNQLQLQVDRSTEAIAGLFETGKYYDALEALTLMSDEMERMSDAGMSLDEQAVRMADAYSAAMGAPVVRAGGIPVSIGGGIDRGGDPAIFDRDIYQAQFGGAETATSTMEVSTDAIMGNMKEAGTGAQTIYDYTERTLGVMPGVVEQTSVMASKFAAGENAMTGITTLLEELSQEPVKIRINFEYNNADLLRIVAQGVSDRGGANEFFGNDR